MPTTSLTSPAHFFQACQQRALVDALPPITLRSLLPLFFSGARWCASLTKRPLLPTEKRYKPGNRTFVLSDLHAWQRYPYKKPQNKSLEKGNRGWWDQTSARIGNWFVCPEQQKTKGFVLQRNKMFCSCAIYRQTVMFWFPNLIYQNMLMLKSHYLTNTTHFSKPVHKYHKHRWSRNGITCHSELYFYKNLYT